MKNSNLQPRKVFFNPFFLIFFGFSFFIFLNLKLKSGFSHAEIYSTFVFGCGLLYFIFQIWVPYIIYGERGFRAPFHLGRKEFKWLEIKRVVPSKFIDGFQFKTNTGFMIYIGFFTKDHLSHMKKIVFLIQKHNPNLEIPSFILKRIKDKK